MKITISEKEHDYTTCTCSECAIIRAIFQKWG